MKMWGEFLGAPRSTDKILIPQLLLISPILYLHSVDILKVCMKEIGSKNIIFDKMTAMRT